VSHGCENHLHMRKSLMLPLVGFQSIEMAFTNLSTLSGNIDLDRLPFLGYHLKD
jgi:hypothetical protein